MTTAVLLGLMLAFEPIDKDVMRRPPAPSRCGDPDHCADACAFLLVSAMLLGGSFGLFLWELETGASLEQARTVAVNVFVMGELFYLFNCPLDDSLAFPCRIFFQCLAVEAAWGYDRAPAFVYLCAGDEPLFASAPIGLDGLGRSWRSGWSSISSSRRKKPGGGKRHEA